MIFNTDNFRTRNPLKITSIATLGLERISSQSAEKYLSYNLKQISLGTSKGEDDFSRYRYKGVNCLSELYFTDEFEQGFGESKAGYCKKGKIKAKRYRIVDLQEHRFINSSGEVTDF